MNSKVLAAFISTAVLTTTSCSVKGDRTPCPCWLDIYLENASDFSDNAFLTGWNKDGECLYRADIVPLNGIECHEAKVEKGFIISSAVLGASAARISGDGILIPYGQECDRYYASSHDAVDCTGEFGEDHLTIHKQHAVLHVQPRISLPSSENVSFWLSGQVSGMSLSTLTPVTGEFGCPLVPDESGNWCACIPRQKDESLALEVIVGDTVYLDIPVGPMIARTGYSWQKADLDDIFITVDISIQSSVSISLKGWDEEHYTFTI